MKSKVIKFPQKGMEMKKKLSKQHKKMIIFGAVAAFVGYITYISMGNMQPQTDQPYTGSCVQVDENKPASGWGNRLQQADLVVQPKEKNMKCYFNLRRDDIAREKPEQAKLFRKIKQEDGTYVWIKKDIANQLKKGKKAASYGVPINGTPQQATAHFEGLAATTRIGRR